MRIEPQSEIVLAHGLENHQDTDTYYVQAVIRNAKTDALIATVNLTDQGNRRFTKAWRVPADPTGEGFDVLVTYTTYTDSGYSVKSENYGERFYDYRIEHTPRHSGGGGVDVDYKRVRKIVEEELGKLELPTPEKPQKVDLLPVIDALHTVVEEVRANKPKEPTPTDLRPVMARFDAVDKAIQAVEIPETDLSPVLDGQEEIKAEIKKANLQDVLAAGNGILDKIKQFFTGDMDEIKAEVSSIKKELGKIAYVTLQGGKSINDEQE